MISQVLVLTAIVNLGSSHIITAPTRLRRTPKNNDVWWRELNEETLRQEKDNLRNKIVQPDAVTYELGAPEYEIIHDDEKPEIITQNQSNYYSSLQLMGQLSSEVVEKKQEKPSLGKAKRNVTKLNRSAEDTEKTSSIVNFVIKEYTTKKAPTPKKVVEQPVEKKVSLEDVKSTAPETKNFGRKLAAQAETPTYQKYKYTQSPHEKPAYELYPGRLLSRLYYKNAPQYIAPSAWPAPTLQPAPQTDKLNVIDESYTPDANTFIYYRQGHNAESDHLPHVRDFEMLYNNAVKRFL